MPLFSDDEFLVATLHAEASTTTGEHDLCLLEVWHTARGNEIRQAEGPRPRTIPGPEAWYWMGRWCEREGIDLSTWDCYS